MASRRGKLRALNYASHIIASILVTAYGTLAYHYAVTPHLGHTWMPGLLGFFGAIILLGGLFYVIGSFFNLHDCGHFGVFQIPKEIHRYDREG